MLSRIAGSVRDGGRDTLANPVASKSLAPKVIRPLALTRMALV